MIEFRCVYRGSGMTRIREIFRGRLMATTLIVVAFVFATVSFAALWDPFGGGWPIAASGGAFGAAIGNGLRTYARARDDHRPHPWLRGLLVFAGFLVAFGCWLVLISALHAVVSSEPTISALSGFLLFAGAVLSIPAAALWERTPEKRRLVVVVTVAMYAAFSFLAYVFSAGQDLRGIPGYEPPIGYEPPNLSLFITGAVVLGIAAVLFHKLPLSEYGREAS
jgi:hypothetical protein